MGADSGGSLSGVPNGQIIDFVRAELRHVPSHDHLHLWVKGRLPMGGLAARLAPRIYFGRPDYWGIEVAAVTSPANAQDAGRAGDGLDFECSVPLIGITGTRGITVIGANQIKRIEIAGESF
jgi:hypothetical protein